MRSRLVAMTLMTVVALAGRVLAHEGHQHKVMGKVVSIDEKTITVEALDAKKVTGMLGADTKYTRDKAPVTRTDVRVGERVVVVIVEEHQMQMVKQVLLGAAAAHDKGAADKP
jgi:hypothetical protein